MTVLAGLLPFANIVFAPLARASSPAPLAPTSCSDAELEAGTCASSSVAPRRGRSLLQGLNVGLRSTQQEGGCPVSENKQLYVDSCGAGYATPSWMDSPLAADCVDGLKFGREVGQICRNENFNVGKGIIVVHGQNSDRTQMWSGNGGWGNLLLRRGYVVLSIDYKSGDCEIDIAAASRFFQDPANMPSADFVVEPGNIGLFGFSLGGICAARAAIFESDSQQAVVCLSGGAKSGPAKEVHSGVPPTLLLWGNEDCQTDITSGDFWYKKMTNKGYDMTFHVFDGNMKNTHTHVYKSYPCSQEWATDFFDTKLGTTQQAPTMPPTATVPPTTTVPAGPTSSVTWEVHTEDAKCDNGSSEDVADLQACLDLAAKNKVPFATFQPSKNKCKASESTCKVKGKSGSTVYKAV